jgi:hypothetical protein
MKSEAPRFSVSRLTGDGHETLKHETNHSQKSIHPMRTGSCVLSLLFLTLSLHAAEPDQDYWEKWRDRQKAELAKLPQPPQPPEGKSSNPIDRFLEPYWARQGYRPPEVVADRLFARRVYLDVIGLPPTETQLESFLKDNDPRKRDKLIDTLLADPQGYAEHWMAFWNDLLRNDEQTNIDGLRKPITPWLYESLLANKPLDLFTAELLNPGPKGPDG